MNPPNEAQAHPLHPLLCALGVGQLAAFDYADFQAEE